MRAVVVTEYGGPDVLRQVEVDEPHAGKGQGADQGSRRERQSRRRAATGG